MVSVVTLFSGGLDSALMAVLAAEKGVDQHLVFIDYGQRAARREWDAANLIARNRTLPAPVRIDLHGYGEHVPSGLTSTALDVNADAFLPGRNLLFLLVGSAYAYRYGAEAVAIGLLRVTGQPRFPDKPPPFVDRARDILRVAMEMPGLEIETPLGEFTKNDVIAMAAERGIRGTYSCHSGGARPCGECISCQEFDEAGGAARGRPEKT